MERFCEKCGTELDKATGMCPKCNADWMSGQKEVVSISYDENDEVINSREKPKGPVNEQAVNSIQKKMRQSRTVLNYKQNGYVQNPKTAQMILHFYHNIPDQRPSQQWFDEIISLVKSFYGNC